MPLLRSLPIGRCEVSVGWIAVLRRDGYRRSLLQRGVEGALHLHDVVLVEPVNLHDCARRIGWLAPQFFLHLVHDWPEPEHVSHINYDANAITQARAF